jgi:hypothetical protein
MRIATAAAAAAYANASYYCLHVCQGLQWRLAGVHAGCQDDGERGYLKRRRRKREARGTPWRLACSELVPRAGGAAANNTA